MKNQLIKITLFLSAFSLAMPFATATSNESEAQHPTKSMEAHTLLNNAKNHITKNWEKYLNGALIAGLATGTILFIKQRREYNQLNAKKNRISDVKDDIVEIFKLFEADVMDTMIKNFKARNVDEDSAELSCKALLSKENISFFDIAKYKAYRKYQRSLKQDSDAALLYSNELD
jgi:uncharacterized membrane-anchored protein YhcB (DUF1043 family)